jgi:hypothetical protein
VTAAASGQFVALAFAATDANATDVFSAVSLNGGATFGAPVRVNAKPGDARVGGEQPPRVALILHKGARPDIAIVWTTKSAEGTRLVTARSTDGGRTFGAQSVVPGSDGAGNRGWESVAVGNAGQLYTMWLDHRESVKPAGETMPMSDMKHDPNAKASLSKLYFASLSDRTPRIITPGVCYCCKTSLVAGADNTVYGAWRHVFADNQRDIGFTMSRDGGRTFAPIIRVSADGWQFDGCPENGPALAVDHGGRVFVAWPTPPDGKSESPLALFIAMSNDGRTFLPRVRIPTQGPAGHVQMSVVGGGAVLLTWDELSASGPRIRLTLARASGAGKVIFEELPSPDAVAGTYPVVAVTAAGAIAAWTRKEAAGSVIAVTRVAVPGMR